MSRTGPPLNILRIGVVPYLNALPLYRYLPYPVSYGTPAELSRQMLAGELDIALLPTFTFLKEPTFYPLYEGGVIQSHGAVESVALFYKKNLRDPLFIRSINLSSESITSIALFKVIYSKFWKQDFNRLIESDDVADGHLMIGDRALFYKNPDFKKLDLGEEWTKHTSLPFVYALWVSREKPPEEVLSAFSQAKKEGIVHREEIIKGINDYPQDRIRDYLTKSIQYEITLPALEGLKKFQDYCLEWGLLKERRQLLGL